MTLICFHKKSKIDLLKKLHKPFTSLLFFSGSRHILILKYKTFQTKIYITYFLWLMNVSSYKFIDLSNLETYMNDKRFNFENLRHWWTEPIQIDFNGKVTGLFRTDLVYTSSKPYITRKCYDNSLSCAINTDSHYKEEKVMYK